MKQSLTLREIEKWIKDLEAKRDTLLTARSLKGSLTNEERIFLGQLRMCITSCHAMRTAKKEEVM